MKKTLATAGTALAALLVLTGCSSAQDDAAPTAAATPTSEASAAPATNVCEDGTLTVTDASEAKGALETGCDTVYLLTSNVELELGPVQQLGIEGNGNTVRTETLGSVYVMGTGNTVTHTGDALDLSNVGEGNTVTAE